MDGVEPLVRLFAAVDHRAQRVAQTPWGAVVTDPRFPLIHDANHARIDRGERVSLAEVRDALVPALHVAGAAWFHVATFDPVGSKPLLDELETDGAKFTYDTVMRFAGPAPELRARHHVVELDPAEPGFWKEQAAVLPEMGVEGEALEQYLDWQREVLVPFGKRWFGVRDDDATLLGSAALLTHEDAAYVDDVVTAPHARRRGVASSLVTHIVVEAKRTAQDVWLLADEPGPIRLYGELGFVEAGLVVGALERLR